MRCGGETKDGHLHPCLSFCLSFACYVAVREGTTDVIAHTEDFLVEYKQWSWSNTTGLIKHTASGTRHDPFNITPMGVNSISVGSPHVRCTPMGRTCGEPNEIKKNTHPEHTTALFRAQGCASHLQQQQQQ